MRKDTTTAKLTEYEKERNKAISKKRYVVEPYGMGTKIALDEEEEVMEGMRACSAQGRYSTGCDSTLG